MNFFEHQDQARRKTGRLVVLFIIAVILILLAVNLATWGILHLISPHVAFMQDAAPVLREDLRYPGTQHRAEPLWTNPAIYAAVSIATLLIITGGSLYKTAALSGGGHAVASMLRGRSVDPGAAQGRDRVLLNVVEEMSIASGVPVPTVYLLEHEPAINAFAAGFTTEDAVIGVTRGCVEKLNRDELQGVIAHEFSHILNGDMRLNIRLIGILHGILVIGLMGYAMLRTMQYMRFSRGRSEKGVNPALLLALAGAAMLVIGYVGVFFGRLIQAAVSRQREFLADASAVQFTRNPRGIAGALMKIAGDSAGSRVQNYHAVEVAHLFFSQGISAGITGLLATHPPIAERIRRIDPTPTQTLVTPPSQPAGAPISALESSAAGFAASVPRPRSADTGPRARVAIDPSLVTQRAGAPTPASLEYATDLLRSIPPLLIDAAHDPFSARSVVFCLVISQDATVRQKQLGVIHAMLGGEAHRDVLRLMDEVQALGPAARLPLVDLTLPALRRMSPDQIRQFRQMARTLVEADARITLFEYALLKVLAQNLKLPDQAARRTPARYLAISAVRDEAAILLTALARASESDTRSAFEAGARRIDPERPPAIAPLADLRDVNAALDKLEQASPPVKQRIIDAAAFTVASDGHITVAEAELLRAIASAMDVPLPPLLMSAKA